MRWGSNLTRGPRVRSVRSDCFRSLLAPRAFGCLSAVLNSALVRCPIGYVQDHPWGSKADHVVLHPNLPHRNRSDRDDQVFRRKAASPIVGTGRNKPSALHYLRYRRVGKKSPVGRDYFSLRICVKESTCAEPLLVNNPRSSTNVKRLKERIDGPIEMSRALTATSTAHAKHDQADRYDEDRPPEQSLHHGLTLPFAAHQYAGLVPGREGRRRNDEGLAARDLPVMTELATGTADSTHPTVIADCLRIRSDEG